MANVTRVISRAIRQRLDWNRIGIAIGLLIVAIAAVTLAQLLRDIEIDKVIAALRSKSIREVLIAGVFVAIGFVALSFYDFFALRTIGRDAVPYRVAAFASFTSYTIGHNLGATVFTAGAYAMPPPSTNALPSQNVSPVTKAILTTSATHRPQAE